MTPPQATTEDDPGLVSPAALRRRGLAAGDLVWWGDREPAPAWFDPDWLADNGCLRGTATGRGTTYFVRLDGQDLVLRHYRRGGVLGDLLGDRYIWTGLERTRPWRELGVQAELYQRGLPVPRPVGARLDYPGRFSPFYRANLLSERLTGTQTLAESLSAGRLARPIWHDIGCVLARFHATGLEHADLNAHNILLDADGRVSLIDFDRAVLHAGPGKWAPANLVRLRRSLDKLAGQRDGFAFDNDDWEVLTAAYEAEREAGARSVRTERMASR